MNFKEGTRRLALLLGVIGAILGGFVSYSELQATLGQRARHIEFEKLANSNEVKHRIDEPAPGISLAGLGQTTLEQFGAKVKDKYPEYAKYSNVEIGQTVLEKYPQYISAIATPDSLSRWKSFSAQQREEALAQMSSAQKRQLAADFGYKPALAEDSAESQAPIKSEIEKAGVKSIQWTKQRGVESIETQDGQTLYPIPAPSAWLYLLVPLFPVLGFFIPWGAVRAIGWVGAGFVAGLK